MPRGNPSLRHHKPSGRAVVTLDGRDHYCGEWGTPEAKERYHRILAEHLETKRVGAQAKADAVKRGNGSTPPAPTVAALILAFWKHAELHYRHPDGTPTGELENFKHALRPVRKLYSMVPIAEFGPKALRAVQGEMVRDGLARTVVNARVNRIRRVFKWGVSVELIPPEILVALKSVPPLQRGRTEAREPDPVEPVPIEVVEATIPFMPRPVAGMVRLQLLTGMRPGEAMAIRPCDVVPGEPNWTYRPAAHKSAWRGKSRVIPLGPRARALLAEFVTTSTTGHYFRPSDALAEYKAKRAAARKSKLKPREVARKARATSRAADRYPRYSYTHAVASACDRAFPHPELSALTPGKLTPEQAAMLKAWRKEHRWHPNQLRHTVATEVRAKFGLEAAQNVLGHARADVTQVYAERDLARAHDVASKIG